MHYEVLGDYDGVLYTKCEDCQELKNIHTEVTFDTTKTRSKYTPLYQYKDGLLVGYSKHKAEGLTIDDDINKSENLLWGTRGKDGKSPLTFRPIKDLEVAHINSIIVNNHTKNKEYLGAFTERLSSILTINK